ncbi:hypothetical protein CN327_28830 [Bacillus cereus]|uniref:Phage protein n=3 Tax=Bacillus nitratireducens TaxID=2026193 RepID=A0ABU6PMM3_9BACI|nr:hypothetical protein [Bacillus nitratireducens]EJS46370.1 hypothetical protein ICG_05740 [Bacillus cereus BAG1X1-3]EOO75974.1 hypothetical protein IC7_05899 [Bacillus cereus BAG1O-1]PDY21429.1 hypothetical protein COM83_23735 [Bacillus cereus]MDR4173962.1 hypothetical protein [Bacillus nitratireducens]MED4681860.1 hypothetical protein [Bacillus nitratireducens]
MIKFEFYRKVSDGMKLYSNVLDIIYCHTQEQADELYDFYVKKGYKVGVSTVEIDTGTLGKCVVKKIDIYK